MTIEKGEKLTKNGITLTVDFIDKGEVYYKKYKERTNQTQNDWDLFLGAHRVPIEQWNKQPPNSVVDINGVKPNNPVQPPAPTEPEK